jgi:thiol-disulfide isomerase/thioredoxin
MEKEYIKKIYYIVIVIAVMVAINLIISLIGNGNTTVKEATSTNDNSKTSEDSSSSYDVSMMNTLTIDQVVDLFSNKKGTYVVYLGRSTCSACQSFLPTLQKMQSKYNYKTQYLDITNVDTSSTAYSTLIDKLATEKTINVNGTSKTDKFGSFYGYTPMVFIIKNGKFADGIVGAYSETAFETFLNDNGIK